MSPEIPPAALPPPVLVSFDVQAVYIYESIFARQQAENWDPADKDAVNLHGYSQAVAKAAIRSGLSRVLQRYLVAGKGTMSGAGVGLKRNLSQVSTKEGRGS